MNLINKEIHDNCKLNKLCKDKKCDFTCYPYALISNFEKVSNIPNKYKKCLEENFIEIEPAVSKEKINNFIRRTHELVKKGVGLYLFSPATIDNPKGTGTGKTTTAATIANEYIKRRTISHLTTEDKLNNNPVLFIDAVSLQNIYNLQFRSIQEEKEKAAFKFSLFKEQAAKVELLVLDDIAVRHATDAYLNELLDIINSRINNELSTIYTSNCSISELSDLLGERIASRIEGSTNIFPLKGNDKRKKGW